MKKYKWHKIANSVEELGFKSNGLLETEVEGKRICLAKTEKGLFACAAKCPHASGELAEGEIDGAGNIVCPIHRYKFDPENGRNVSGEGYYLKTYPLEVREDGIYIGLQDGGIFGW